MVGAAGLEPAASCSQSKYGFFEIFAVFLYLYLKSMIYECILTAQKRIKTHIFARFSCNLAVYSQYIRSMKNAVFAKIRSIKWSF